MKSLNALVTPKTSSATWAGNAGTKQPERHGGVELTKVALDYGSGPVLQGIDLSIAPGELFCLLGPSGCGKTTTLNIIAGFLRPNSGDVHIGGEKVTNLPSHKRRLGMVFQSYALLPHLTVYENVAFGPRRQRLQSDQIDERVREALQAVHLEETAGRYPAALSGGQQQRVGLARALAVRPKVLLLDEPLSNLDAKLRREMQYEIRRLHDDYNLTSVYVTHDQEEAMVLADRMAVMNGGHIEQMGPPRHVYKNVTSSFVAHFLGERNFFYARVVEDLGDQYTLSTGTATYAAVCGASHRYLPGEEVELSIPEESVKVLSDHETGPNIGRAEVVQTVYRGGRSQLILDAGFAIVRAQIEADSEGGFKQGQIVAFELPTDELNIVGYATPQTDSGPEDT